MAGQTAQENSETATFVVQNSEEPRRDSNAKSTSMLLPGMVLGDEYELIEQIGHGGMGVIWKANDRVADRLVALKFVPGDLRRFDAEVKRLYAMFKKVHALNHQAICPLYSLKDGKHLGYYLVMKYLDGDTLDSHIDEIDPERKGLPLQQVVELLMPVAKALDYAHRNGVLHRDIKPSNIFLKKTAKGTEVQLIDFGLAEEIRATLSHVDIADLDVSGTPLYMSPEQWKGARQTATTDQYALAAVAYELLAGHPPFEGSNFVIMRNTVLEIAPEPIPTLPDSANAALLKALAKEGKGRFANCVEFFRALSESLSERSAKANTLPTHSAAKHSAWIIATCCVLIIVLGTFIVRAPQISDWNTNSTPWNATPASPYKSSWNDIFEAAMLGTASEIQYFLDNGSDVNQKDERTRIANRNLGNTPLHYALRYNPDAEVVRFLVAQGADTDVQNTNGWTPLHNAVQYHFNADVEVVKLLVTHGADISVRSNNGWAPLDMAAYFNADVEVLEFLISQGADVNAKRHNDCTPLHAAVHPDPSMEVAKILVARGADVNAQTDRGWAPLHQVAQFHSDIELATFLVSQGANVNIRSLGGWTPLNSAAEHNSNAEMTRFLISVGANVNARSNSGLTPLHSASRKNANLDVFEALLDGGANLNSQTYQAGTFPLHFAAENNTVEVLEYLIYRGADVNAKDFQGRTPLDIADTEEKKQILLEAGGKTGSELQM